MQKRAGLRLRLWGVAVAVSVRNRDKTRVDAMIDAMSVVVHGLGLLLEERSG